MSTPTLRVSLNKASNVSEYIKGHNDTLSDNLQNLTKLLYEFGQNEKSYKKSNKKSRNLHDNVLVTHDFGVDEIWSQIKDQSQSVLSTVDHRAKYRQNERDRIQSIINQLQNEVNEKDGQDSGLDDFENILIEEDDEDDNDNDESNGNDELNNKDDDDDNEQLDEEDDWLNIIKHRRKQQLDEKNKNNDNDDEESKQSKEDDDVLDIDAFQKQTDEMQEFIDKQWNKETELDEQGTLNLLNDDIEQRALLIDDENDIENENENENDKESDIDDNDNYKSKHNESIDDDFNFLNKHIAKDDEDDNHENVEENNDDNDEWNDLFNLPKFKNNKKDTQENENEMKHNENFSKLQDKFDEENMSKFELEERAIKYRIAKLQEENLKDRSWEYQGEISNNKFTHPNIKRDRNSLLSTYIDFDYSDKLKPVITEDLNQSIENLIITKIKNEQFDDVEKKRDFAAAPQTAKRKLVEIQDTKSSMGLAELYEREYLQQVEEKNKELINDDDFISSKDATLQKQYEKISRLKSNLFYELDQLTRFHYEPKSAVIQTNIKSKTHTNALFHEDIVPFTNIHNADQAMNMAPEQLYKKPKHFKHIKGENEMTSSDRKNKRRFNKKRNQYIQGIKNENNKQRSIYDDKFKKHLNRLNALNDVRTHAMAAAKKNGIDINQIARDDTRYTSSKQMFEKIQQHQDNKNKKRQLIMDGINEDTSTPPEKKRKIMSMRS